MLDLKFIRDHRETVEHAIKNRGARMDITELLRLDAQRRAVLTGLEALRHEKRVASDAVARAKAQGQAIDEQVSALKGASQREQQLEEQIGGLDRQIKEVLLLVPNVPHHSVPVGPDAGANRQVRSWGEPRQYPCAPRTHVELGEYLGLIDLR